jgi:hypothetical protein
MRARTIDVICDETMAQRTNDESSPIKFVPFSHQLHIGPDAI